MAAERIGILLETGDPATAGILPLECVQGWLRPEPDLVVLGAPSWSDAGAAERIQSACQQHRLGRLVLCGPSPESSQLPDWLPGASPGVGIPIHYAAVREHAAWTDRDANRAATKAKRLIEIAVARAQGRPGLPGGGDRQPPRGGARLRSSRLPGR